MKKIAIIIASRQGLAPALTIHRNFPEQNYSTQAKERQIPVPPSTRSRPLSPPILPATKVSSLSALSASVSGPSPCIQSKYTDPAVVNIDSTGKHAISVLSRTRWRSQRTHPQACFHTWGRPRHHDPKRQQRPLGP